MEKREDELILVARKACFGLPIACPICLPVYIYLKFAQIPFKLEYNLIYPDSDQIPYVEYGTYVAFNNEKGGVIENLKEDGIVNLDSTFHAIPEWLSTKAMVTTWLAEALMYELWVGFAESPAYKIYYSDLPFPIGKYLHYKQAWTTKQLLGITEENAERKEKEIYRKAASAYEALSTRLGEQTFFFEDRPTSLDAEFLGHAVFTLQVFPESSILRSELLKHSNLVRYADKFNLEFIEGSSSSSSNAHADPLPSFPRRGSKPKSKPKKEKTEEEKKFKRRAKYFLVTQLVAVLVFLSLLGGSDDADVDLENDDDDVDYE